MRNGSREPTWIPSAFRELERGFEVVFLYIVIENTTRFNLISHLYQLIFPLLTQNMSSSALSVSSSSDGGGQDSIDWRLNCRIIPLWYEATSGQHVDVAMLQ
jgi:hypothetical protein